MRFGSVCSGIEAASMAWQPLGWECAFVSEIDKFPSELLSQRHPDAPNLGDMTNFKEWPDATIDVLVGGTPCQSFSVAGLRGGLDDSRGNLMLTYGAIARRYRPQWVVWENVPGVFSSNGGTDFGSFLGLMSGQSIECPASGWQNSGVIPGIKGAYGLAWRVLDAQYFGVPQRRRRVFVVGYLGDWRRAAAVLFERHSLQGHPAPSRETGQRPAPTISARTKGGGGLGTDFDLDGGLIGGIDCENNGHGADRSTGPLETGSRSGGGRPLPAICISSGQANAEIQNDVGTTLTTLTTLHEAPIVAHALRAEGFDGSEDGSEDGTGRGTPLVAFSCKDHGADAMEELSPTLRAGSHAESHANAGVMPAIAFESRYVRNGRGAPSDIVPPLKAQSGESGKGDAAPLIAFHNRQYPDASFDVTHPLGAKDNGMGMGMQVRRLTPRECERLQGFPDDYTLIAVRGKPAADGPRYKALGNSMAVPVMRWIGERIAMVAALKMKEAA